MSSTQILDIASNSEKGAFMGIMELLALAFTLSFLPLLLIALPRSRDTRDPSEGEFPGTGALITLFFSAIGFGLWFAPISIVVGTIGQSTWLPSTIAMGALVIAAGLRVSSNGEIGVMRALANWLHSMLSEPLRGWTSQEEASDDLHLGLWVAIVVMISDPTLVIQGILSESNTPLVGPLVSIVIFWAFSLVGGAISLSLRLLVSLSGDIGRILGPMSIRIRAKTWGIGLVSIGIWWIFRDSLLAFTTVL